MEKNVEKEKEKQEKPKEQHREEHTAVSKKRKLAFTDKIFILLISVSVIYIAYLYFQDTIISFLKANPNLWAFFSHIINQISAGTLLGLFYATFFGSLFFIFLPIEALLLYYLTLGHSIPFVIVLSMLGIIMGLCLDYLFGFIVGARIIKFFLREKFDTFHKKIAKWGAVIIFFGNVIIFPIQPVSVIIGSARYSFKKFVFFTALGLFAKLFLLLVANLYLKDYIYPFVRVFG